MNRVFLVYCKKSTLNWKRGRLTTLLCEHLGLNFRVFNESWISVNLLCLFDWFSVQLQMRTLHSIKSNSTSAISWLWKYIQYQRKLNTQGGISHMCITLLLLPLHTFIAHRTHTSHICIAHRMRTPHNASHIARAHCTYASRIARAYRICIAHCTHASHTCTAHRTWPYTYHTWQGLWKP